MQIVLAPDAYKGSLTAFEVSQTMKSAISNLDPTYEVVEIPMSDGGEGFLTCFEHVPGVKEVHVPCHNALGHVIQAPILIMPDQTVLVEYAEIAGLPQIEKALRNPDETTSYGLGEILLYIVNHGYSNVVIGIGGSATNDAGYGMLSALGMTAYDEAGTKLGPMGKDFLKISSLNLNDAVNRLENLSITIASDVENSLLGREGASYTFGPQKGASYQQVIAYEQGHRNFADLLLKAGLSDEADRIGAGAAGGLGFALYLLGGKRVAGAEFCAEFLKLDNYIKHADVLITGEGKSDAQTIQGKVPHYVAKCAHKNGKPIVLISGALEEIDQLNQVFTACFSIGDRPLSEAESILYAKTLLYERTKSIFRLIKAFTP